MTLIGFCLVDLSELAVTPCRSALCSGRDAGPRRPRWSLLAGVVVVVSALNIVQDVRQTRERNAELTGMLEREREQERLLRVAVESERAAHHRVRLRRYAAVVAQAGECWKSGRIDLIRGSLDELEPRLGEDDPREFAWHYLSGRVSEQVILRSKQPDLECVALAPGGRWFASGGDDGSVVVWDLSAGNRLTELGRLAGPISGLTILTRWQSDGCSRR